MEYKKNDFSPERESVRTEEPQNPEFCMIFPSKDEDDVVSTGQS